MVINNKQTRKEFWLLMLATYSAEQIEKALKSLPPERLRILELHYFSKYALKDIAPIINRSVSFVRQQHNRGILQLQDYFNNQPFDHEKETTPKK